MLSWAARHPDYTAMSDDLAARRCADVLGLKALGTEVPSTSALECLEEIAS